MNLIKVENIITKYKEFPSFEIVEKHAFGFINKENLNFIVPIHEGYYELHFVDGSLVVAGVDLNNIYEDLLNGK